MRELIKELLSVRVYKGSLGRLVRRLTMIGIMVVFACGAYAYYATIITGITALDGNATKGLIAGLICAFGGWFAFRLINWPTFADFLISVEAEMLKVSWPGKAEVYSSTVVVLVMFAILATLIFCFDMIWITIFRWIHVMPT